MIEADHTGGHGGSIPTGRPGARLNPMKPEESCPLAEQRPKGPKPWLPPENRAPRLLIIRLSALGDVLHALPVLSALRDRFPEATIDWAVEDRAADLLVGRADLDRVLVFPRQRLNAAVRGVPNPLEAVRAARGFVREMRGGDYDVALDLQGNLKSGAVLRASGAELRFGPGGEAAKEGNQLFSQRRAVPPPGAVHRVERNLALASALLGETLPYVAPGFPVGPKDREAADRILQGTGMGSESFVVLQPGTSGFGAFKRWPPDRFGSLARSLARDGHQVLVTYGPGEEPLAAAVGASAGAAVRLLQPPSLTVLAEVIRRARLFVAADTGPLHLAALVGTPLVGLFGPKDPAVYGPLRCARGRHTGRAAGAHAGRHRVPPLHAAPLRGSAVHADHGA